MTKRRMILLVALLLAGLSTSRLSRIQAADEDKKHLDAVQTTEKFLDDGLNGRAKDAAELGEPGKAYSCEDKIKKSFGDLKAEKISLVRVLVDDEFALAITEPVTETKRNQKGSLSLRLIKKEDRWLIRDVDFGDGRAEKNLKRFQRERPKAEVVIPKKDK
ncbi:MAG: hypothetical protein ACYC3I_07850 [Gemmataceae bacterium]